MTDTFKFLDQKKGDAYNELQRRQLEANGGSTVANASEGFVPGGEAYAKYGKMPGTESTSSVSTTPSVGGGTDRYADYTNSNNGDIAFTDTWQDGAKYQQLRGTGVLNNQDFDAQFASAKGGQDTKTIADDGGGWKLIKLEKGEKTDERKLRYKDIAAEWQAAGYDVRVQDHNPDFEGGTGEIAVRVGQAQSTETEPEKERTPIEHSDEIKQAKARVKSYEDDVISGKMSNDIYGRQTENKNDQYDLNLNKGSQGIGTAAPDDQAKSKATANFLDVKKAEIKTKYDFKPKEVSN